MILCGCSPQGSEKDSGSDASGANSTQSGQSTAQNGNAASSASGQDAAGDSAQEPDDDGIVYDEDGAVVQTPSKYVATTQMVVDLSDQAMGNTGETLRLAFLTSKKELDDYYASNKEKYALDKTDSGSDFQTTVKDLNDVFFEKNNVLLIVQSYDKDKGIEIGDTYIEDKGAVIDVYKENPRAPDKTAYIMNVICYQKEDVPRMPEIKQLAPGGMVTEESDPDVIVSLGDDPDESSDQEPEDDGPLYEIDENDNVRLIEE